MNNTNTINAASLEDEIAKYDRGMETRRNAIRANAGRRLANNRLPQLSVPPAPNRPMAVQISDANGDYVGTWAYGVSQQDAMEEASANASGPFSVKMVPAYR